MDKNFNLSKVKLDPNGGLMADYQITTTADGEPTVIDRTERADRDPHPDLKAAVQALAPIVGRVIGITSFLSLLESSDMKMTDRQKESARDFSKELLNRIDVRGLAWSGTGDTLGVVITAVVETDNGQKTCVNTPRLRFSTISYGFEEELEAMVARINEEVYEYLFKGKQSQLSLFGDGNKQEEE